MAAMTENNLRSAHGGESMAHMRYMAWADKAEQEGYANVGRLFRAISFSEKVHATNHFVALKDVAGDFTVTAGAGFGLAGTSENLQGAIDGENFEVFEMYPAFVEVAKLQQERGAQRSMIWALECEKLHAGMYGAAKQAVDAGNDVELGAVQVCEKCGYTHEGDAPDKCPICGVRRERFKEFS
jgi:rubrerythrin